MTKENTPISLPPDNPISSSKDDVLGWESTATTFAHRTLMLDATRGLVVGVFGPWGSGKTSFINLARPEFKQEGITVLDFNPWLFSGADQLVYRFFVELSAEMGETEEALDLEKIRGYFQKYGGVLSPAIAATSTLAGSPDAGIAISSFLKLFPKKNKEPASAIAVRNKLTEILEKRNKPIIVVIDDVDRLPIDEIRELFKLIRLTASFPNLIYIVACDRVRVEAALEEDMPRVRGNYLEKISQWSINIPIAPHEQLRSELLGGIKNALGDIKPPLDHKDWPDIEAEIIRPLIRNIRDVRRYSMAVRGTVDDLSSMVALVDILALEAIRLFMPGVFEKLPHLVEDLAALPILEGYRQRREDILEQIGDANNSEEARRSSLEDLVESVGLEHQKIVRALIGRLFSGGRSQHEREDQEWPSKQLRNNRVVHSNIFRLYLTRVADSELVASNSARNAFDCLHDHHALQKFIRSNDPETWEKIIFSLWGMFRHDFSSNHAESGLVVFWNLLPDMPNKDSMFADESVRAIRIVSESLLKTLVGTDSKSDLIDNIFRQLQSYSSKVGLIKQIIKLNTKKEPLLSDDEITILKMRLNNQILSANTDELVKERHPAQVLIFPAQCANVSKYAQISHDSPRLTFTLLWDCQTESSTGELGTRSTETERGIHWDTLISIHGGERMLRVRIESLIENFNMIEPWIVSELGIQFSDAQLLLQLAKNKFSNRILN
ncbi:MAG: P-loop NTPase fold protein [Gammaproteobacteria bacterium]|nr:P-loop NTPase fold protein [Gammaproteobacteria bacterium]